MSPSSGKIEKNNSHFITAIILLFTFQIQFVLSDLNALGTDNKEALLQQWGAIRLDKLNLETKKKYFSFLFDQ